MSSTSLDHPSPELQSPCQHSVPEAEKPQKRGRKLDIEQRNRMKNFFDSLPKRNSHYNLDNQNQFIALENVTKVKHLFQLYNRNEDPTLNTPHLSNFRKFYREEIKPQGVMLQPLKVDVCNKCLRLTFNVAHSCGEERKSIQEDLIAHQQESRIENLAMKEMNFIIVVLENSENFVSEVFRRDCDPASNCYWPKYPEQV